MKSKKDMAFDKERAKFRSEIQKLRNQINELKNNIRELKYRNTHLLEYMNMPEEDMRGKYTKTIMKLQRPIIGDTVLMYNEERKIIGEFPMDSAFEMLFGNRDKIYCQCKYRNSDGYLEIGEEVEADF